MRPRQWLLFVIMLVLISACSKDSDDLGSPSTTWRPLPPAPIGERARPLAMLSGDGRRVVLWGGLSRAVGQARDGAEFELASLKWTALPEAPPVANAFPGGALEDDRLTIIGAQKCATDATGPSGYQLSFQAQRYVDIPAAPVAGSCNVAVAATSAGLLVWDFALPGQPGFLLDPIRLGWRSIAAAPAVAQSSITGGMPSLPVQLVARADFVYAYGLESWWALNVGMT